MSQHPTKAEREAVAKAAIGDLAARIAAAEAQDAWRRTTDNGVEKLSPAAAQMILKLDAKLAVIEGSFGGQRRSLADTHPDVYDALLKRAARIPDATGTPASPLKGILN